MRPTHRLSRPGLHGLCVLLLVLLLPGIPRAGDLEGLARDSRDFAREMAGGNIPEQASLLWQAARLMLEQEECDLAWDLSVQALRRTREPGSGQWAGAATAALCARNWKDASLAASLALELARDDSQRGKALSLLIPALEMRQKHGWTNWLPALEQAYAQALELGPDRRLEQRLRRVRERIRAGFELRMTGSEVQIHGGRPRICMTFSQELPPADGTPYASFVSITPAFKPVFSVHDENLCVDGASYGATYEITLRPGLPGTAQNLESAHTFTVATGHREPALWLNTSAYVLPRGSQAGPSLRAVNVEEIQVRLLRIHERNIVSDFVRSNFRTRLSDYDLERLATTYGAEVFTTTMRLEPERDREKLYSLVLPDGVRDAPGLYVLSVRNARDEDVERWQGQPTQWLVVSDIGLTTYAATDGLTVLVRTLSGARPAAGVELTLVARNNTPLARAVTDARGIARFAPGLMRATGGDRPVQLTALHPDLGFCFLSLEQAPFDLSDRGVTGRKAPGPLDVYAFTERGIYRPGETVNLTALLRDGHGRGVTPLPLTLRMLGPDGEAQLTRVLAPREDGTYASAISLARSLHAGTYTLTLGPDKDSVAGQTSFRVDSFKPPRIALDLRGPDLLQGPGGTTEQIQVTARFLYGAPAADLEVTGRIMVGLDPRPFPELTKQGYSFVHDGEQEEARWNELPVLRTGAQGEALLPLDLPDLPDTGAPLLATTEVQVLDVDGRPVSKLLRIPLRPRKLYVGVRARQSQQEAAQQGRAAFDVLLVDAAGGPVVGELDWRLIRRDIEWQWFHDGSAWDCERRVYEHEEERGTLRVTADRPGLVEFPVRWGDYRLEVRDRSGNPVAMVNFTAGSGVRSSADRPDAAVVEAASESHIPGETALLRIRSPWAGQGTVVIADERVLDVLDFATGPDGRAEVEVPVRGDWNGGAYALVTVFRPGSSGEEGPGRALGVVWLSLDREKRRLVPELTLPQVARPDTRLEVPVHIQGLEPGARAQLVLAAVDEAVLGLTGFTTPDPLEHYLGQRRLATEIRDLYGRLISTRGERLLLRQGGDGDEGLRGAPLENVRIASLFSGLVSVDGQGRAVVGLDLPPFNGELRVMAVAWSGDRFGSAAAPLTVRSPVVMDPSLPRFLAVGDQTRLNVLLHNLEGPAGTYTLSLEGSEALGILGPGTLELHLEEGERQVAGFDIEAVATGTASLRLALRGPGMEMDRDLALGIRGRDLPVLRRRLLRLDPGKGYVPDAALSAGLEPGSLRLDLSVSSTVNVDVPALLRALDRYPYGCSEQVVSRAMPLLYVNELAIRWGLEVDTALDGRIARTIETLARRQYYDGTFGLWSRFDAAGPWLTAYVMDFLVRARAMGHPVPDQVYAWGLDALDSLVEEDLSGDKDELAAAAYAHFVLTLAGRPRPELCRYFHANPGKSIRSPLAMAHLGAALAMQGGLQEGRAALARALEMEPDPRAWRHYGSSLRDLAAILATLADTGMDLLDPAPAWARLARDLTARRHLSTQEQCRLVMAARALPPASPLHLELADGTPAGSGEVFHARLGPPALGSGTAVLFNRGDAPVWVSATVQGQSLEPEENLRQGLAIDRSIYTLDGSPVGKQGLELGGTYMVVLRGEALGENPLRALVVDLLPAGLEVVKTGEQLQGYDRPYPWLPRLSAVRYQDGRDDRFVAALDLDPSGQQRKAFSLDRPKGGVVRPFTLAYMVRASAAGLFTHPPPHVEDMYNPETRGSGSAGLLPVLAP